MIAQLHDIVNDVVYNTDPHQFTAYDHLAQNPRAALFLEMSLQKTVITASYLYDMHYNEAAILKTLIIAPNNVANITWPNEFKKWGHLQDARISLISGTPAQRLKALAADAEIFIVSVDNAAWLVDQYVIEKNRRHKGAIPFDCVVIDESSFFKNRGSVRFKKVSRALEPVEYIIELSGTPAPNGYIDLWAQFFLLDRGARLGKTFTNYVQTYFTTRSNGMVVVEYKLRPGAQTLIAKRIKDISLMMRTRDHKELPPMEIIDEVIQLDDFDFGIYEELEREYVLEFLQYDDWQNEILYDDYYEGIPPEQTEPPAVTVKTAADLTNKLLQITSGAIYEDREAPKDVRVWHELNRAKLDKLRELVDEFSNETFLVIYQFRHELERVLKEFPYARALRKGKLALQDFQDWNSGKIKMLVIHPASAGHGLNLQFGGRRQVWLTPTWNLEHWLQTIARLLRTGAVDPIFVHRLIIEGTRDQAVIKRTNSKDTNQNFLFKEVQQLRKKYGTIR